jgi:autophagy-related protein 2
MPKRLLQYALSRLEILDTDALDLENLDIAFGKNSTFEFRDVGLRLKVVQLGCSIQVVVMLLMYLLNV